jgi:hypothetical protein
MNSSVEFSLEKQFLVTRHASLMISALLRTIMIRMMMRMTELRAKPEPKDKQYIENNLKIFPSANLPTIAFSACYILLPCCAPRPVPKTIV